MPASITLSRLRTICAGLIAATLCLWSAHAGDGHAHGRVIHDGKAPLDIAALPAGSLKSTLQSLAPKARAKALGVLNTMPIHAAEITKLRVRDTGDVIIACAFAAQAADEPATAENTTVVAPIDTLTTVPIDQLPAFNSRPGAAGTLYVDFDGGSLTNTFWNADYGVTSFDYRPFSQDADETTFSVADQLWILDMVSRIAEAFRPYDVNVTTVEPQAYGPGVGHIIMTPQYDANGVWLPGREIGAAGYAPLGVVGGANAAYMAHCWVYTDTVNDPGQLGNIATHEGGHMVGLYHDGSSAGAYYGGHGDWAPIMGGGMGRDLRQWSQGDYPDADSQQNDLHEITKHWSLTADDAADSPANAAQLGVSGNMISQTGEIGITSISASERVADVDVYTIDVGDGVLSLTATTVDFGTAYTTATSRGATLPIKLELLDHAGEPVASYSDGETLDASLSVTVTSGRYYVRVSGDAGTTGTLGYSDYASLGSYTITGTFAQGTVADPVISPAGGYFYPTQEVSITCDTPGATIRYTTDNRTPTPESPIYTGPITISESARITAMAFKDGFTDSQPVFENFSRMVKSERVWISPEGQNFYPTIEVELYTQSQQATIYYTTDGSDPTTDSPVYDKWISLDTTTTIKAFSIRENYLPGDITSATFTLYQETAPTPVISPDGGAFAGSQQVTLSTPDGVGTIHYTLDGSTPTGSSPTYGAPFTIDADTTVQAICVIPDYLDSAVATAVFTRIPTLTPPEILPGPATFWPDLEITLTDTSGVDANLHYTLDGSTPTTDSPIYTGPITITATTIVKAFAAKDGYLSSGTVGVEYIYERPTVATPVISPDGGTFSEPQSVTITTATPGAGIWYTIDGSDPLSSATRIAYSGPITLTDDTVLRAFAWAYGQFNSPEASASFTIGIKTYTISGSVTGVGSAVLISAGGQTTTTQLTGKGKSKSWIYSLTLDAGAYDVVASLAGYSFSPSAVPVDLTGGDVSGVDFIGTADGGSGGSGYSISGEITGVNSPVAVSAGGQTVQSYEQGKGKGAKWVYSIDGLEDGAYTVAASLDGYSFAPASIAVSLSGASVSGVDFTGTADSGGGTGPWSISGEITGVDQAVTVSFGSYSAQSSLQGRGKNARWTYTISDIPDGTSAQLSASLSGYSFSPGGIDLTLTGDLSGQDFAGSATSPYTPAPTIDSAWYTISADGLLSLELEATGADSIQWYIGDEPVSSTLTLPGGTYTATVVAGNVGGETAATIQVVVP